MTNLNHTPLVSVGIPTYNRAESLKRAIISVINQTYSNLEIIISDNASTDNTQQVCEEFCQFDPRITYIRQPENFGAGNNFKFVLEKAQGEYFMWLADDDWIDISYILLCVTFLIENLDYSLVAGKAIYYLNNSEIDYPMTVFNSSHRKAERRLLSYYSQVWDNGIFYGVIRKKEIILSSIPECLGGDWLLVASIVFQGKVKTFNEINVHRLTKAGDSLEKLALRMGLSGFHRRYPMLSISISASTDILKNNAYDSLSLVPRLLLSFRVLSLLVSKYSLPALKHYLVVKLAKNMPRIVYPYVRAFYRKITA